MTAVKLENDLHQICSTPLEWRYGSSGERDDEPWESFDAELPATDLAATFSRELMAGGLIEQYYVGVRKGTRTTVSLCGSEAERLFWSLKESYLDAKALGVEKFNVGSTFPAAYETTSSLERLTTCLKHGVLDFRAAQILEAIYAAATETPVGQGGWERSTQFQTSDVDGRKEEVTTFSLDLMGLKVELSRFSPVIDREWDGSSSYGTVPEGIDFLLSVKSRHGEEIFSDYGSRAYRVFENVIRRDKASLTSSSNAA